MSWNKGKSSNTFNTFNRLFANRNSIKNTQFFNPLCWILMAFLASPPWPLQLSPALPPWNPFRHQHRWLKAIRWASNVHEWPNHDNLAGTPVGFDVWDVTGNYVEKFPIFCDWYLGRRKLSMSETKGCEISSMSLEITGLLCSPCKNSPWHAGGFVHLHLWCRIVVHDTPVDVHSEGFFWVLSSRLLGWKIRRRARACTSGVRVCVRVTTKSKPLMKTHINYGCKMPPSAPQCQWSASIIELQYVKIRSPFFRTENMAAMFEALSFEIRFSEFVGKCTCHIGKFWEFNP